MKDAREPVIMSTDQYPDWGSFNGEYPLDLNLSASSILSAVAVETGVWAINHRGALAGVALGVALPLVFVHEARADSNPPAGGQTDWVETGLKIAENVTFPVLLGLGNAVRVYSGRKGEKERMATQVKSLQSEAAELSNYDVKQLAMDAAQHGVRITNEAEARQYQSAELEKMNNMIAELGKSAGKYAKSRLWLEAAREFVEGGLFGVVAQSLPQVILDFWRNYRDAVDLPTKVDLSLKLAGWAVAAGSLANIAWQTQDPAGKAGAKDRELYKVLRKRGMIK